MKAILWLPVDPDVSNRAEASVRSTRCAVASVYAALHELHIVRPLQWSRVAPEAFRSDYWYRSATIGSTLAARRAGNKLAVRAKAMSTRAAVTNVAGSAGEMPKRS